MNTSGISGANCAFSDLKAVKNACQDFQGLCILYIISAMVFSFLYGFHIVKISVQIHHAVFHMDFVWGFKLQYVYVIRCPEIKVPPQKLCLSFDVLTWSY